MEAHKLSYVDWSEEYEAKCLYYHEILLKLASRLGFEPRTHGFGGQHVTVTTSTYRAPMHTPDENTAS